MDELYLAVTTEACHLRTRLKILLLGCEQLGVVEAAQAAQQGVDATNQILTAIRLTREAERLAREAEKEKRA
jgi:hypothetical protein